MTDAFATAERQIENAARSGSFELDLSGLGLTELPESIAKLNRHTFLSLADNRLTNLPETLGRLRLLKRVVARLNRQCLPQKTCLPGLKRFQRRDRAMRPRCCRLRIVSPKMRAAAFLSFPRGHGNELRHGEHILPSLRLDRARDLQFMQLTDRFDETRLRADKTGMSPHDVPNLADVPIVFTR